MSFDSLMDILRKVRQQNPVFSRRVEEAEALSRWEQAVGPGIARNSRAIRVQEKVLFVEVDHPIWRSELHHRKKQILDILNNVKANATKATQAVLEDIVFLEPRTGSRDPRRR